MKSVKRGTVRISNKSPESYSTKSLVIPFYKHTSASRGDMFMSQLKSAMMPLEAEIPNNDSALSPEILRRSTCIQAVQFKNVTVLARFNYHLDVFIIYEENEVIKSMVFHPYNYSRDWATPNVSDLLEVPIGEVVEISDLPFRIEAIESYNPSTDTVGYGKNVTCITSIDRKNEEDGTYISSKTLSEFCGIKHRDLEIYINDTFIKGFGDSVLPPVGKIIDGEVLMTLVKSAKYKCIASLGNPVIDDDTIILSPNSFLSRIEVICNNKLENKCLEELRLKRLKWRQNIYQFLSTLDKSRFDYFTHCVFENCKYELFRIKELELDKPLIRLTVNRLDIPGFGAKFTTTAGGKFTVDGIYPDGAYKDDKGRHIDLILSGSSIIKRENYSTAYFEKHINAIFMHIRQCVLDNLIDANKLYDIYDTIYKIAGESMHNDFVRQKLTPEELHMLVSYRMTRWIDMPESSLMSIPKFAEIQLYLMKLGIPRVDHDIFFNGIKLTSKHEVGSIFLIKLLNDVEFAAQMSGVVEVDTRGYPLDKSNSKLTSRSYWSVKPGKFSDLALNILVNVLKNEYVDIMLNDNPNYSLNEYMNAIGGELVLTSNRDSRSIKNIEFDDELDEFDIGYDYDTDMEENGGYEGY